MPGLFDLSSPSYATSGDPGQALLANLLGAGPTGLVLQPKANSGLSDPSSMPLLGLLQGLGAAGATSRMPVSNAQALGLAAEGYQQGLMNQQQYQQSIIDTQQKQLDFGGDVQLTGLIMDALKKRAGQAGGGDVAAAAGGGTTPPAGGGGGAQVPQFDFSSIYSPTGVSSGPTVPTAGQSKLAAAAAKTKADLARSGFAVTQPDQTSGGGATGVDPSAYSQTGVDFNDFERRMRQNESGGKQFAANPSSSAVGFDQFTKGTWRAQMRARPEYADYTDAQLDQLRTGGPTGDPALADRLNRENTISLAQADGNTLGKYNLPVNNTTLAVAHRLGAGDGNSGATAVLLAPDGTPMKSLVTPKAYNANPDMRGKTNTQFVAMTARKMGAAPPAQGGQQTVQVGPQQTAAQVSTLTPQAAQQAQSAGQQALATNNTAASPAASASSPETASQGSTVDGGGGGQTSTYNPSDMIQNLFANMTPEKAVFLRGLGLKGIENLILKQQTIMSPQEAKDAGYKDGSVVARDIANNQTVLQAGHDTYRYIQAGSQDPEDIKVSGGLAGKYNETLKEFEPDAAQLQGFSADVAREMQTGKVGKQLYDSLPKATQIELDNMHSGLQAPYTSNTGRFTPHGNQMTNLISMVYPDYTGNEYQERHDTTTSLDKGFLSNTFNSTNKVSQHVQDALKLMDALANNDWTTVNKIKNSVSAEFGNADVSNVRAIANLITGEVATATIAGSGGRVTEKDRDKAQSTAPSEGSSPAQIHGWADNVIYPMIGTTLDNAHQQIVAGHLPETEFYKRMVPQNLEIWRKHQAAMRAMGYGGAGTAYGAGGGEPAAVKANPGEQIYMDANGNRAVKRNGKYVEVQ